MQARLLKSPSQVRSLSGCLRQSVDGRPGQERWHQRSASLRALDVSRWSLPKRDDRNRLGTLRSKTAAVLVSVREVRLNVAYQNIQRGHKMKRYKSALIFGHWMGMSGRANVTHQRAGAMRLISKPAQPPAPLHAMVIRRMRLTSGGHKPPTSHSNAYGSLCVDIAM